MRLIAIIFVFLLSQALSIGQKKTSTFHDKIESIAESQSSNDAITEYQYADLEHYLRHSILLDSTCENHLRKLPFLNPVQLEGILNHIEDFGTIEELDELRRIENLDDKLINELRPFIKFENNSLKVANTIDRRASYFLRYRIKQVVQQSEGFKNEHQFKGNPMSFHKRYEFNWQKKIEAGINLEKDAGEVFIDKKQGADFISAYFSMNNFKRVERLIIGDYRVDFGQGLTYSSFGGLGKSSEVLLISRNSHGIRPYKSLTEWAYLRGIAATLRNKNLHITGFYSNKAVDASIKSDEQGSTISSFYKTGLHRNENEIKKKFSAHTSTAGLDLLYNLKSLNLGGLIVKEEYKWPLTSENRLENLHDLNGFQKCNAGVYFSLSKVNYTIFGEASASNNYGKAFILGTLIMLDPSLSFAFSIRNYGVDYSAISSTAFGENQNNRNENGLYSAIKLKLRKRCHISLYTDRYEFPWLKNGVSGPSKGIDYYSDLVYDVTKNQEFLIRLKWKEKESDLLVEGSKIPIITHEIRKSLRMQYMIHVNETIRIRSRIEFSDYLFSSLSEQGILLFQEVNYRKIGSRFSFLGRYTLFDTEGYNSRIYTYEQGLTGTFSIPSFSGKGSKLICLVKYKLSRMVKITFKLSHLIYDDKQSIGQGLNEIKGPEKTELQWQCDVAF